VFTEIIITLPRGNGTVVDPEATMTAFGRPTL
jgi:hypothetical protein